MKYKLMCERENNDQIDFGTFPTLHAAQLAMQTHTLGMLCTYRSTTRTTTDHAGMYKIVKTYTDKEIKAKLAKLHADAYATMHDLDDMRADGVGLMTGIVDSLYLVIYQIEHAQDQLPK